MYDALLWLKSNNVLYKDIVIPQYDTFQNAILNIEIVILWILMIIVKFLKQMLMTKSKIFQLLLTQKNPTDEFYEQYTINSLNEPCQNAKAVDLYQMLRIDTNSIDQRDLNLDLKCFPVLFPYGKDGQYSKRLVNLSSSEFVKSRLLSMNPIFRTNIQYLFFLLHDANIRALKSGIYHKLRTVKSKDKFTSSECLEMLKKNELEGNLTTIFARIRNTSQY